MAFLSRFVILVLLSCFLFSNYNRVEGGKILSEEEDNELEDQLKLLNKPAIKTIQTKYGDTYDCVDFYKQPAFDHPLLKNHTFDYQMKPSSVPNLMPKEEKLLNTTNNKPIAMGLMRINCPLGTVPIRRVSKVGLIRAKLYSKKYGSKFGVLTPENPGTHYSVVRTKFELQKEYYGGATHIKTHNPIASGPQYSSARLKLSHSSDSIQVGWTVNPTLYGDTNTRLYLYTSTGQLHCFNVQCPGFVILGRQIPIDMVLKVAKRGEKWFYHVHFVIFKDKPTGNWWLAVGKEGYKIGFWPKEIFTNLSNLASTVEWGGEVFSPPNIPSPQMGSGDMPRLNTRYDAICFELSTINEDDNSVDAEDTEIYNDIPAYKTIDAGYSKGIYKRLMFFGGCGGAVGNSYSNLSVEINQ